VSALWRRHSRESDRRAKYVLVREMPALIGLAYASLLLLSVLDNLRSPFFPEILNDMHWNNFAGSAFFATTSLFCFLASWWSQSVIRRHSSLFLLGSASFFLAVGYASIAWSYNFLTMMLACAVFGFAFGGHNLAQNMIVVEASPVHLRRRLLNGLHSMYGVASIIAPLMASGFLLLGWTWRSAFFATATLPLLTVVAVQFFKSRKPVKISAHPEPLSSDEWKLCILFAIMMALYQFGETSASSRLVLWLRTERGFAPETANLYLSGFFAFMLVGRVFFGVVHFRRLSNWMILCGSAGLSAICYALGLAASPLWLVVSGLAMAPFYATALDQLSVTFHKKSGQAFGFILGVGSLSSVAMHLVVGWGTDVFGLTRALTIGPVSLAVLFVSLGGFMLNQEIKAASPSRKGLF
jgi:FHS family glucose/mannose:H+ symporter-like MFS transporter